MKNPVVYSVSEAKKLKRRRQFRYIAVISSVLIILLLSIIITHVTDTKTQIENKYGTDPTSNSSTSTPQSETTEISEFSSLITTPFDSSETTEPSTIETSENPLLLDENDGGDAGTADVASNSDNEENTPKTPTPTPVPNIFIQENSPIRTLTYQERDSLYNQLKLDIEKILVDSENTRISVVYANLKNKENFGFETQKPFIPAGLMSLPVCIDLFMQVEANAIQLSETIELTQADFSNGSSVYTEEADIGSSRTLSELVQNALIMGDNASISAIIRRLGGIDTINDRLKGISNVVDFRTKIEYVDYKKVRQSGTNRTSTQDIANYTRFFYQQYLSQSSIYQSLFDAFCSTTSDWGVGSSVPENVIKGRKTGKNSTFGSLNSVAIIFAEEPYLLCVMTETANEEEGKNLHRKIDQLVYNYIHTSYIESPSDVPVTQTAP